jgi:hypothetical protein
MTALDLTVGSVLNRAADLIEENGHGVDDFTPDSGGYCVAGAIAEAAGINPDDWDDTNTGSPDASDYTTWGEYQEALEAWRAGRRASLQALRAFLAHLNPGATPETLSRSSLIEVISVWNDDDTRTASEVVAALRAAAAGAQS